MGVFLVCWGTFAAILAVTDLEISRAWANPHTQWAQWLAVWGQYPGVLTVCGAVCILVVHRSRCVGDGVSQRVQLFAKVTLWNAVLTYSVLHGVKAVWGRVRFEDLDMAATQYTPWYLPQGFTGHESFFSGHTTVGWWCLPLVILCGGHSRTLSWISLLVTGGWGIVVAVSRVRIGAHYASDVLFASGCGILTMVLLYRFFAVSGGVKP